MVEFNLLPDVKMDYLRTKRTEHSVITISFIVGAASLAVFILLFVFVEVFQKVTLNDLTNQISTSSAKLNTSPNLNKILTVQKQLETIPQLENQTPKVSQLFGYISQVTPLTATISTLNISFTANTITLSGGADSLATVNTFVDTLKYAQFNDATAKTTGTLAFSSVVLSSFSYDSTSTPPATFSIALNFNPIIFDSAHNVTLVVPTQTTTRSIINQPDLFKSNTP